MSKELREERYQSIININQVMNTSICNNTYAYIYINIYAHIYTPDSLVYLHSPPLPPHTHSHSYKLNHAHNQTNIHKQAYFTLIPSIGPSIIH